jgi:glycerophosphoryl diester phosphodiesterase
MRSPPVEAPAWLVARPIAHRGLHDAASGIVENSAAAAAAAMERGFAIECDVQLTSDGDAVVFHDFTLDRLTRVSGLVLAHTVQALTGIAYAAGRDRIVALGTFLDLIAGRVPLVCEIKSRFDGDLRLADRVAALARDYRGPIAIKSFDPRVIAHLRRDPPCPLGIVAEADYGDAEWSALSDALKRELAEVLHFGETRPDFLSYHVGDLPHAVPYLCRTALGLPVMTWTVRRPEQRALAAAWADQIVFEGFIP